MLLFFHLYPRNERAETQFQDLIFQCTNQGVPAQGHHILENQMPSLHYEKYETDGYAYDMPLVENPEIPGGFQTLIRVLFLNQILSKSNLDKPAFISLPALNLTTALRGMTTSVSGRLGLRPTRDFRICTSKHQSSEVQHSCRSLELY